MQRWLALLRLRANIVVQRLLREGTELGGWSPNPSMQRWAQVGPTLVTWVRYTLAQAWGHFNRGWYMIGTTLVRQGWVPSLAQPPNMFQNIPVTSL